MIVIILYNLPMENIEKIEITAINAENLLAYSQMLKKHPNVIINEALEEYFDIQHKKMLEKNLNDENVLTNLDYDEFWDGVDI
jgi:hypothetical protein